MPWGQKQREQTCGGVGHHRPPKNRVKTLKFFARIQEYSIEDYVNKVERLTEKQLPDDLARQIHRNAQIASDKHSWVRKSLLWSFWGAIPWALAIVMLVKT